MSFKSGTGHSFDTCFRVWAVFDRDEHPYVEDALRLAVAEKIDVAFSNPCFELWPILHLRDYGAQDGRHDVQRHLRALMPAYDHQDGAIINFEQIKDHVFTAHDRAEVLNDAREAEGAPLSNPATTVNKLVLKIIQNGKWGKRKP